MPTPRINVSSGRPLEALAHYSRALRVGECVLQSGTTAIDREGNVIGAGDIGRQVDAVFAIAEESMGAAGGRLADVVSARVYVKGAEHMAGAVAATARHLESARPTLSVVPVSALARPAQLVEIELEAIDGAADAAQRIVAQDGAEPVSAALRLGERVWLSGAAGPSAAARAGDIAGQTDRVFGWIREMLAELGAGIGDVVCARTSLVRPEDVGPHRSARLAQIGETRPASTLLLTPAFDDPAQRLEVEVEARVGATARRRDYYSEDAWERPLGFASAVEAGDRLYVSGAASFEAGRVAHPDDWARQYDRCVEQIQAVLEGAGSGLADVVQRRTFTVADATSNRAYGEGPPWFAESRPAALGCRIAALALPGLLVEIDAIAVRGAGEGIEWKELDA